MLLSWIFRGFLIAAGFVASWFVAKDAPHQWSPCNAKHARPGTSVRYRQRVCGGEEPAIDEALGNEAE